MDRSNRRLFRRAPALALAITALVSPATAQAQAVPPSVTLDGTYTLVHVDGTVGHPGADGFRQELLSGGSAYDVRLGSGVSFRSGDSVRLSGHLDGSRLDVAHSSITAFAPDNPTVAGTTRVLVILADWTAPDATTQASAADVFAADNSWFNQTSYGHLSLSTTVTNWVHVSAPAAGLCSDSSVSDLLVNRSLAAAGYSAASFDRVVVYFPTSSDPSCSNVAGFAEAPGSRVWLNGTMDARSSIHEQGHNYGLYHAHSASCTAPGTADADVAPDPAADNCSYSDYGDPFDAMGASGLVAEYNASQKNDLGWLDGGRRATLSAGGSVDLVPYEEQSTGVHAAVYGASPTRSYWFESRTATGPDASLPSGATAGVLVHVDDSTVDAQAGEASSWAPVQSYLLDQSPADHSLDTSVLPYGASWTSPEGITFTVGSPGGATVTISASQPGVSPVGGSSGGAPPAIQQASSLTADLPDGVGTARLTQGGAVQLSGTVLRPDGTAAAGVSVQVQSSRHGLGRWQTVDTQTSSATGAVVSTLRPQGTSDYRLLVAASGTETGSVSNLVTVIVRPFVVAAVTRPTVVHGRTVGLNVSIPGHAGQVVTVQRWSHNAWRPYATVRLGSTGKRSVAVKLAVKGHYRYRFVMAPDAFHLGAESKTLQVRAL